MTEHIHIDLSNLTREDAHRGREDALALIAAYDSWDEQTRDAELARVLNLPLREQALILYSLTEVGHGLAVAVSAGRGDDFSDVLSVLNEIGNTLNRFHRENE